MAVTLVTGYVRLDSGHRSHARYLELGRRLLDVGLPTFAFYDGDPGELRAPETTDVRPASLSECWLYRPARKAAPPRNGRPDKDTVNYCIVQHQKSAWLAQAARLCGGHLIWVDFGIFHLTAAVTTEHILGLFDAVGAMQPEKICMAGIWPMEGRPLIDWGLPAWYVAGGVVVMPAGQAAWFHETCVRYATLQLETNHRTTWEVNTWSAVLRDHPDRFSVYPADHNEALFTGYAP